MIVVVGGIKGGTGKTTLATNLVVMRSQERKVLFVDADELEGSSEWVEHRKSLEIPTEWTTIKLTGKQIHQEIKKLAKDYDDVIIDVGGRDTWSQRSCLLACDLLIVPFRPRTPDIWTLEKMQMIVESAKQNNEKLKCIAVLNQADYNGKDNDDAKAVLKLHPYLEVFPKKIVLRKAFHNAFSEGVGIVELKKKDHSALLEILEFYRFIYM